MKTDENQTDYELMVMFGQKAVCADQYEFIPGKGFADFRKAISIALEADIFNPHLIMVVGARELRGVLRPKNNKILVKS